MAGGTLVTPIIGKAHWDDLQQIWRGSASFQEKDVGGSTPWKETIEDFLTLAQLIQWLLSVWAAPGSTVGAPIGDISGLITWMQAWEGTFTPGSSVVAPSPVVFPGTDFTDPPYDGATDTWGVTP